MKAGVCFAPASSAIYGKTAAPAQPEGCAFLFQQMHSPRYGKSKPIFRRRNSPAVGGAEAFAASGGEGANIAF